MVTIYVIEIVSAVYGYDCYCCFDCLFVAHCLLTFAAELISLLKDNKNDSYSLTVLFMNKTSLFVNNALNYPF